MVTLIDLRGSQLGRTTTQADGRYAVAAPAEGTYVLIASGGARQPQATTITVADGLVDFDLVLSGAAGLTGTVLASPDDRPLPGALVTATDVRGEVVASAAADHTGEFGIADLSPGNYTLVVSAPGHRPAALPAEVAAAPPTATRSASPLAPTSTAPSATARAARSTTPGSRSSTRRATRSPRRSPTRTAPTRSTTWTPATTP